LVAWISRKSAADAAAPVSFASRALSSLQFILQKIALLANVGILVFVVWFWL